MMIFFEERRFGFCLFLVSMDWVWEELILGMKGTRLTMGCFSLTSNFHFGSVGMSRRVLWVGRFDEAGYIHYKLLGFDYIPTKDEEIGFP
jgi:hypothetical protein